MNEHQTSVEGITEPEQCPEFNRESFNFLIKTDRSRTSQRGITLNAILVKLARLGASKLSFAKQP